MNSTLPRLGAALVAIALVGCGPPEDEGGFAGGGTGGGSTSGSSLCPAGMVVGSENGVSAVSLGEDRGDVLVAYPGTVLPLYSTALDPYCVGTFPLPGVSGEAYLPDGLNVGQADLLDELLADYGRRLCTVSELLYAAAGPSNLVHPYGNDYDAEACGTEALFPTPLGGRPDCTSPSGARDFLVRSSWAVLDDDARGAVEPTLQEGDDIPSDYAVYGGTAQRDTFFAPTNRGIHFYGPGDYSADVPSYETDDVRVCADLGTLDADTEAAWQTVVSDLVSAGSYRAALGPGLEFSR